jgi:hypothetical protein
MSAFIDELTNLLGPDLVSVDLADRQHHARNGR